MGHDFRKCQPVNEGCQDFDKLPEAFQTKEMKQAMKTLKDFSQNQKRFMLYHSRMDAQLELNTLPIRLIKSDLF